LLPTAGHPRTRRPPGHRVDPLRDEGLIYAQRLFQAGVSTELHHYPGTFHGSALIEDVGVTQRMIADQLGALRRGLRAALPTSKA
jgi:acetyl esterase/lipase